MANICFDKYVADMKDIDDDVDGYNDVKKDKNCSFFNGKPADRTSMDIINGVSPHDGCCFSISKNKNVINVRNVAELDNYIEKLKTDYKTVFVSTQPSELGENGEPINMTPKIILDTINNSQTMEILENKINVKHMKKHAPKLLKFYQRLFLGVEQDVNKVKKLIKQLENVNPFDDIQTFQNENNKHKEFRDVGSEEQKIFFYDRTSYATYEAIFYAMLSVVGILFLRTQLKN